MTSYSMYFNKKHKRVGSLFQNHFLASRITSDEYLWHVSRYIHLNPLDIRKEWQTYRYSSIGDYLNPPARQWVKPNYLVESADEIRQYGEFVADDVTAHQDLSLLKRLLANERDI